VAPPVNADIPAEIDVSFVNEVDSNAGALGAEGFLALGATGVPAGVANAVFGAVGTKFKELSITPGRCMEAVH
jgi:xanthine dehydrogenase YagR molybdenum-binding subunit